MCSLGIREGQDWLYWGQMATNRPVPKRGNGVYVGSASGQRIDGNCGHLTSSPPNSMEPGKEEFLTGERVLNPRLAGMHCAVVGQGLGQNDLVDLRRVWPRTVKERRKWEAQGTGLLDGAEQRLLLERKAWIGFLGAQTQETQDGGFRGRGGQHCKQSW